MPANSSLDRASNLTDDADDLDCTPTHPLDLDCIHHLQTSLLDSEKAQRMAEFFSFLGDANRLRIIAALALKELCVHELAAIVQMSESAVSHQLRNLRAIRLVSYRKEGRKVFYRLKDNHVLNLYEAVAEHIDEKD
ncbi:helix-turn-helix transcriptional regulator [Oxynema sp. CENA135]|jgi:DNA-binding transcriptional ArsR family regulator|uniref:Helix-turn-helix transcriptional regulator n=1 Tax=Oxynema aestuarii AP17 TaxID=2064643 RepID=A0A6H1U281_9CYAN|nr:MULTISPECIES: metalloregulator ArsR/SmtB family transcription factor [Oxynema]MBK4731312.1 helix-turn-helix transcriptional regulator [Oxynema sp. CENA135]QIZ72944.1 helix-turn-helix transcriptional regulator [Oxynema aestuarii AP17]RMH78501.1 MAG: transcriptional regulator [Cyanobacteria bacterium J007]